MPAEIQRREGRDFSLFRSRHVAENFAEIRRAEDVPELLKIAGERGLGTVFLGGGSNIFFASRRIRQLVMKNALPEVVEHLGGDRFRVSSSVPMLKLLRRMKELGRDCFYCLASAPCQIGGAIAMNAGSGPGEGISVSDYIESVEAANAEGLLTFKKSELGFGYRRSAFLDNPDLFAVGAVFVFPKKKIAGDPIAERMEWAREHQDLRFPNCGSLCSRYDARILRLVRALYRFCPAGLSGKKLNWAQNRSENPAWLASMLRLIEILHALAGRELKFELRIVR